MDHGAGWWSYVRHDPQRDRPQVSRALLRRVASYARPYRGRIALMLSTTLLSSVLAAGDVMTGAVQSVAVYNLGNVDETIEGGHGDLGYFPDDVYYSVNRHLGHDPDIAAIGASLTEHDLLVADETSRQVRSKVCRAAAMAWSTSTARHRATSAHTRPVEGSTSSNVSLENTCSPPIRAG